jgi:uncharacterized protein (DUF58 family)
VAVIRPRRDRRTVGYATLSVVFTAVALLRGQPTDLALAAPFALMVAIGLRGIRPIDVDGSIELESKMYFEGDEIVGSVVLTRPAGMRGTLTIDTAPGWSPLEPAPTLSWDLPADGNRVTVPFRIRADSWGRHRMGRINLSFRRPFGLTVWEATNDVSPSFAVLPSPQHVRQLLPSPASQATAGVHISPIVGDGFDFAELRPFAPGDRLRDINWRASARFDQLQSNRRHPDRSGDVVLLVDTFADGIGTASTTLQAALTRAARAAWSIAQLHLDVQDRVGLATQGRVITQLRPRGGDRARYELLDHLLSVGGMITAGQSATSRQPLSRLPPRALVLALTPLVDQRFAVDVLALHRAGRPVMAVVIELGDLLPPPSDREDELARRLYQLGIDQWRDDLTNAGIPLVTWTGTADLGSVVAVLRRLQRKGAMRR